LLLKKLKSCFITELIELIEPPQIDCQNLCLVLEYMDTDLDQLLKQPDSFNEQHLIKIIYNLLCSMSYIH
jgi:serine/threonine protein kinase